MVNKAAAHRINNKIPLTMPPFATLAQEIEDWLCRQLSPSDRERNCEEATKQNSVTQPGYLFSTVIKTITGRYAVTCGRCMERMGMMNRWGYWGCWKNRAVIVNWLLEEAAGRGHKVSRAQVWSLFQAALREVRQSRNKNAALDNQAP